MDQAVDDEFVGLVRVAHEGGDGLAAVVAVAPADDVVHLAFREGRFGQFAHLGFGRIGRRPGRHLGDHLRL